MATIGDIMRFLRIKHSSGEAATEMDSTPILRPAAITEAVAGDVTFCGSTAGNPEELLRVTQATLVLVDREILARVDTVSGCGRPLFIPCENARLDFIRVVNHFFAPPRPVGIHPTAVIDPSAVIGSDVCIGALSTIGRNVRIGDATTIYAGVHIYDGVRIGRNVKIHSGTVIGADGFGYERNEAGELEKFPHIGSVVIEDDVEIGANTCIDRGSLGDTRIGQGARIDNLVHVGHNVQVGRYAAIIAHAMIGGGTRIGSASWVAPSASIRDRIRVGDSVVVGLGAIVTRDVPDNTTVLGNPAREISEHRRMLSALKVLLQDKSTC